MLADLGCFDNLAESAICSLWIWKCAMPLAERDPGKCAQNKGMRW